MKVVDGEGEGGAVLVDERLLDLRLAAHLDHDGERYGGCEDPQESGRVASTATGPGGHARPPARSRTAARRGRERLSSSVRADNAAGDPVGLRVRSGHRASAPS